LGVPTSAYRQAWDTLVVVVTDHPRAG